MIDAWVASALQTALRGYLKLDPESAARLRGLTGKLIALRIDGPDIEVVIEPDGDTVRVLTGPTRTPDTTIQAPPAAFARLGLAAGKSHFVAGNDIRVSGDSETGRILRDILASVELDWEEMLALRLGDIPAHQLGRLTRGLGRWLRETRTAWRLDTSEYLQEEARLVPTRLELEHFMDEVDTLRSDVDRLEARIQRLDTGKD